MTAIMRTVAGVLLAIALVTPAGAQELRAFAGAGFMSDLNGERFPMAGGGVTIDLGRPWISAGAQGEAFFSGGYPGGRGSVFGQFSVPGLGILRPFALGGAGFGEEAGPMFGGGIEVRAPNRRIGMRLSVEDYIASIEPCPTDSIFSCEASRPSPHQLTVRFAVLF